MSVAPPVEIVPADYPPSLNIAAGANRTSSDPPPAEKIVRIFFFRHAESCANMLKKLGRMREQGSYLDPDITRRGAEIAGIVGQRLRERGILEQDIADTPIRIGASVLLRAQQTAAILKARVASLEGQQFIYVLPYVSEISQATGAWLAGAAGYGKENQAMTRNAKLAISRNSAAWKQEKIPPRLDYRPYDDASSPEKVDVRRFFEWLGTNLRTLFGEEYDRAGTLRLVVVTHAGWLRSLTKQLGEEISYDNVEGLSIEVRYPVSGGTPTSGPTWINRRIQLLSPEERAAIRPCPDRCLSESLCSGIDPEYANRIIDIVNTVMNDRPVPLDAVRALERDLRVEEAYKASPNRTVLQVLDRMKKYGSDAPDLVPDLEELSGALGYNIGIKGRSCDKLHRLRQEIQLSNWGSFPDNTLRSAARKTIRREYRQLLDSYTTRGIFGKKSRRTLAANVDMINDRTGCRKVPLPAQDKPDILRSAAPQGATTRYGPILIRPPGPPDLVEANLQAGVNRARNAGRGGVPQPSRAPPGALRYGPTTGAIGTAAAGRRTWGQFLGFTRGGARRTRRRLQRKRGCRRTRGQQRHRQHTRRH